MINLKMFFKIMGILVLIETVLLLACAGVSLIYQENDIDAFLQVVAGSALLGGVLVLLGRNAQRQLTRRDGYLIVASTWLIFTIIGMLPFLISGYIPRVVDAFFETMSGFTTTGATILSNIESLPHGLLFWRSLTQWTGGLGFIVLIIAALPIFGMGNMQLFSAEAIAPSHQKLAPRISVTARWIWFVYLSLTVAQILFLLMGGMGFFDSICHSFSTVSTGGFSTKQANLAYYNSPYLEYVTTFFMIFAGINFTLLFYLVKGKTKKILFDDELRWYLSSLAVFTTIFSVALYYTSPMGAGESFRKALFQVVSIHTTTGFTSADYATWTPFLWATLGVMMFLGASSGSASGGMRSIRLMILSKMRRNEFKRMIHPSAVLPLKVNKVAVTPSTQSCILLFASLYITTFVVGSLIMMAMGTGLVESFGTVASCLGSVGPGLGSYGPSFSWSTLPDGGKWLLSFLMLAGRMELFALFLIFTPRFWKNR
ncbi:TrkH family potassium uptake protein [Bacteroides sedimenti]|uniref:Potassium transporter n=1 Tax=Bacteroides sedimenti TaxID=2136147 RepID=A0ABN6YZU1_9BACE